MLLLFQSLVLPLKGLHISNNMVKESVIEIVAKVLKVPENSLQQNESLVIYPALKGEACKSL